MSRLGAVAVIAALCAMSPAHGQKAAERYIPLGQSPGVSQKSSAVGEIAGVDGAKRTVTIAGAAGRLTVAITERTRIWLDRSKLEQPNLAGNFTDLQKGRRVEVKVQAPGRRQVADWIKVEIDRP